MLHDRFHGSWEQPKTAASTGSKMSTLVQLRIEKDGRVSNFDIVRSSGNVVVDESVRAVAQKVTRVDPPPSTLAPSGHYDVRINFELDVE
jgi:TonB family protein